MINELRKAIVLRMDEIIKEEIELAKVRANKRMGESVAALSLEFTTWYNMKEYDNEVRIVICKPTATDGQGEGIKDKRTTDGTKEGR